MIESGEFPIRRRAPTVSHITLSMENGVSRFRKIGLCVLFGCNVLVIGKMHGDSNEYRSNNVKKKADEKQQDGATLSKIEAGRGGKILKEQTFNNPLHQKSFVLIVQYCVNDFIRTRQANVML